jgi:hypothetical protein
MASDFNYAIQPSGGGRGVRLGSCTVLNVGPIRTYDRDGVIQMVAPSGYLPDHATRIATKWTIPPSGWNAGQPVGG